MIFDDVLEMAKSVSHFTIAGEGNVSVRDLSLIHISEPTRPY